MRKRKKTRVRRKRRQGKQGLKFGPSAKPRHELLAGRTGKVHAKKLQSGRQG